MASELVEEIAVEENPVLEKRLLAGIALRARPGGLLSG